MARLRLWYQSLAREDAWTPYGVALRRLIDAARDPDTEVHVAGTTKIGGVADQYRYLEYLATGEVLENAARAVREGYDAFLIGNFTDPGLREAREIADIPVLGLCETAMHVAGMMGGSFSFVMLNEKFTPRIVENAVRAGLRDRLAGFGRLTLDRILRMNDAFLDPALRAELCRQFVAAADSEAAGGGEVVMASGGVFMALLAEEGIHRTPKGASVLNGILALVKMGEAAARMNRAMGGAFTSKRLQYRPPEPAQIAEIRKWSGAGVYPTVKAPGKG